jgi:hypothetical protein
MSMDAPYERGQSAAWLEFDENGMRVYRAEVVGVSKEAYDTWLISTTHGQERVNDQGEGPRLVPVDAEIAEEFTRRGDGFRVESTVRDIERSLNQSLDWQTFEQNLGKGRGHKR